MESWTRLGRFWRDRTRGEAGARAPIPCGASEARMRRSADARGKYKYVKARPEFSYSQCPLPYSVPLPSRSRAATVAPRLLDACLLPPLATPLARRPCGARVASTCALENPGDHHTHVRVLRRPNGQRSYARATAHDFSSMRPDLLRSSPTLLLLPLPSSKPAAARPVVRAPPFLEGSLFLDPRRSSISFVDPPFLRWNGRFLIAR